MTVRPLAAGDRSWVAEVLTRSWGSTRVVSRGRVRDAAALPGFVAVDDGGARAGLATYAVDGDACEVVTLDSVSPGRGAGAALLEAAAAEARRRGCRRLWLVTTNDNTDALRFYQRRGWDLVGLRRSAVDEARRSLKPEIPERGLAGIPIRHELELELPLA